MTQKKAAFTLPVETKTQNKYASNPLSIEYLRSQKYPGNNLKIEKTFSENINYTQYIASYMSGNLKIYGLLSVPKTQRPEKGFSAIIFLHGYIPPEKYRTTEKYVTYFDGFARQGYVVFKPDLRENGISEGKPEGAYYSSAYMDDILNAFASVKKLGNPFMRTGTAKQESLEQFIVDSNRIGVWGHSMGGYLTLRAMVVSKDIKAGVIWSGVVGTYSQLLNDWKRKIPFTPSAKEVENHIISIRQNLIEKYATPDKNPEFWKAIDSRTYLKDISGPLQLHQGLSDEEVPPLFSQTLADDLIKNKKTVEYYTYEGADHNLSQSFNLAMNRSVEFFGKYLK